MKAGGRRAAARQNAGSSTPPVVRPAATKSPKPSRREDEKREDKLEALRTAFLKCVQPKFGVRTQIDNASNAAKNATKNCLAPVQTAANSAAASSVGTATAKCLQPLSAAVDRLRGREPDCPLGLIPLRKTFRRWSGLGLTQTVAGALQLRRFQHWSTISKETKHAKTVGLRVLKQWLHHSVADSWRKWAGHAAARRKSISTMQRIVKRWRSAELLAHLLKWRRTCKGLRRSRTKIKRVVKTWRLASLHAGFMALKAATGVSRKKDAKRGKLQRVVSRWRRADLLSCWSRWMARHELVERSAKLARRALHQWSKRGPPGAFRKWRDVSRNKTKMLKVARAWRLGEAQSAMARWRQAATARIYALRVGERVLKRWLQREKSGAWALWIGMIDARKRALKTLDRFVTRWRQRELLFHCLRWRDTCRSCKHNRELLKRVVNSWRRRDLRLAWTAVRSASERSAARKKTRKAVARVVGRWRKLGLAWSWERWVSTYDRTLANRESMEASVASWRKAKRNQCWRQLVGLGRSYGLLRRVLHTWRMKDLEGAVSAWRGVIDERNAALKTARNVLTMWLQRQKSGAWRHWADLCESRREALELIERVATVWRQRELRGGWRQFKASADAAKELSERFAVAHRVVQRWRQQDLSACLRKWVAASEERSARLETIHEAVRTWRQHERAKGWRKLVALLNAAKTLRHVVHTWRTNELRSGLVQWSGHANARRQTYEVGMRCLKLWSAVLLRDGWGRLCEAIVSAIEYERRLGNKASKRILHAYTYPRAFFQWRSESEWRRAKAISDRIHARGWTTVVTRLRAISESFGVWQEAWKVDRGRLNARQRQVWAEVAYRQRMSSARIAASKARGGDMGAMVRMHKKGWPKPSEDDPRAQMAMKASHELSSLEVPQLYEARAQSAVRHLSPARGDRRAMGGIATPPRAPHTDPVTRRLAFEDVDGVSYTHAPSATAHRDATPPLGSPMRPSPKLLGAPSAQQPQQQSPASQSRSLFWEQPPVPQDDAVVLSEGGGSAARQRVPQSHLKALRAASPLAHSQALRPNNTAYDEGSTPSALHTHLSGVKVAAATPQEQLTPYTPSSERHPIAESLHVPSNLSLRERWEKHEQEREWQKGRWSLPLPQQSPSGGQLFERGSRSILLPSPISSNIRRLGPPTNTTAAAAAAAPLPPTPPQSRTTPRATPLRETQAHVAPTSMASPSPRAKGVPSPSGLLHSAVLNRTLQSSNSASALISGPPSSTHTTSQLSFTSRETAAAEEKRFPWRRAPEEKAMERRKAEVARRRRWEDLIALYTKGCSYELAEACGDAARRAYSK